LVCATNRKIENRKRQIFVTTPTYIKHNDNNNNKNSVQLLVYICAELKRQGPVTKSACIKDDSNNNNNNKGNTRTKTDKQGRYVQQLRL
jgi:hypothetical protein